MSLRLPPKVRERMRPSRAVISQRLACGQGTILQRRSCERQSIRRQVLPQPQQYDATAEAMCIEGFKPDAETTLRELLNMPSDFDFSTLDLMTFGDLDAVEMAEYRRRSESETVGVDFPDAAQIKRVFEDVGLAKDEEGSGDEKDADVTSGGELDDGESVILLEEKSAVVNSNCTPFKKDQDDVEIVHVGEASIAGNDSTPMKSEDTSPEASGCIDSEKTDVTSIVASTDSDDSVKILQEGFSAELPKINIAATSMVNPGELAVISPVAREPSPLPALPAIEIPSTPLILPPHSPVGFSSSLLRPVPLNATSFDHLDVVKPGQSEGDDVNMEDNSVLKRASVKIGGAEYRLVLPRGDRSDEKGFDASVADATLLRASTPLNSLASFNVSAATKVIDASFQPIETAAVAATGSDDAQLPTSADAPADSSAAKPALDATGWNLAVDGCQLKKIETLMNSKTLRKAKRKNYYKKSSNIGGAIFLNKQREIFQSFNNADKKIFIVFPESDFPASSAGVKKTKFAFKTLSSAISGGGGKTTKSAKAPKHPSRVPSTPKMFSKAAVQRNVLYMKNGEKLGYKKIKKMSDCPENGHRCNCPLKNKQSICHQEIAAAVATAKEVK